MTIQRNQRHSSTSFSKSFSFMCCFSEDNYINRIYGKKHKNKQPNPYSLGLIVIVFPGSSTNLHLSPMGYHPRDLLYSQQK